ncbi:hypothetical protein [Mycobacterium terramassiliense]|uniref:hypothetical protein n=1 Tax=Mycobacterium terramassiliense TaxID=1841859 RepID=UPI001570409A|nr:hypothetical protein [Mycobacterium terramassiliense]
MIAQPAWFSIEHPVSDNWPYYLQVVGSLGEDGQPHDVQVMVGDECLDPPEAQHFAAVLADAARQAAEIMGDRQEDPSSHELTGELIRRVEAGTLPASDATWLAGELCAAAEIWQYERLGKP